LGTAVPVIGMIQVGVQVIADRYAYLTLIGVFVIVVWEASALADRLRLGLAPRAVAASLVLAALAFITWRQIGYWKSTVDLWTHALQVTTNNALAENYLASELFELGRYQEGMTHLRTYARLEPLDPSAHARVAADYQDHGQLPEAIKEYRASIRAANTLVAHGQPGMSEMLAMTYLNLGLAYAQVGDEAEARDNSRRALDADSEAIGRMVEGLAQYLQQNPTAQGYVRLGLILRQIGRGSEAQQSFARAHQLNPNLTLPSVAVESVR
jgi:tetratricopeptide (TPR) repeat protein